MPYLIIHCPNCPALKIRLQASQQEIGAPAKDQNHKPMKKGVKVLLDDALENPHQKKIDARMDAIGANLKNRCDAVDFPEFLQIEFHTYLASKNAFYYQL